MEIRYFQILIPIVSTLLILLQFKEYKNRKSGIHETVLVTCFWLAVFALSIFPDFFSESIAKIFGIKDNINAIIFLALGILFYLQLKMYKIIKRQDALLTELTRKIALDNYESN